MGKLLAPLVVRHSRTIGELDLVGKILRVVGIMFCEYPSFFFGLKLLVAVIHNLIEFSVFGQRLRYRISNLKLMKWHLEVLHIPRKFLVFV